VVFFKMCDFRGFSEVELNREDNVRSEGDAFKPRKNFKKSPKKSATTTIPILDEVPPGALLSSPTISSSTVEPAEPNESTKPNESQDPDILEGISEENASLSKIELLEQRQKQMEEDNKRKRVLLLKEIADRRQRTAEEASKLAHVQTELQKIDLLVAQDVKILRQTIEVASVEYMQAKKRYDRAEKDFIDAKVNLHGKQERKELLTEHLMTIIEESEDRKSKKLADLMTRLQIDDKVCDM